VKTHSLVTLGALLVFVTSFVACQRSALPANTDGTTTTQASSGSEPQTEPPADAAVSD
jgi:hypothetical protein